MKFDNFLKIIEDFHFYYSYKLKFEKLIIYKYEGKKFEIFEIFSIIYLRDFVSYQRGNFMILGHILLF